MRTHRILKLLSFILFLQFIGCAEYFEHEKFKKPDWLPGKLYTAVAVHGNLSIFAECLRLTGLDTIVDVSGSFTIFAPTDAAIEEYLIENQYASVSDIPSDELERIVEFHIVQNPWTLDQLQSLSPVGWRTGNPSGSSSYAYKRQTILKDPAEKYSVIKWRSREMIILDSTASDYSKKVFVQSRKYVPIFYDEYMDRNGLTSSDYSFYFGRDYEIGNVYYAGAKILQADIFAENGFVHIIDRVVSPMENAKEILGKEMPDETYKLFLEMVYWYYPSFHLNLEATFNQPELRRGALYDTLWDLDYSPLEFDLHSELTGNLSANSNYTLVKHNGLYVPTDDPFREFIDGTLTRNSGFPHWPDIRSLPDDLADIIISRRFTSSPIYPSTSIYKKIFLNNVGFEHNEGDIIRKIFGSNCTFIGLNTYIPDRVFTSVTGPVFLRPVYSIFRQALLYSNIEDDIAYNLGALSFFPMSDYALKKDSSLIKNEGDRNFYEFDRSTETIERLSSSKIRTRIRNHVGMSLPNGSANKEFIRTMGGNYIIWNNSNNTVQGNKPCTIGYNGYEVKTCKPSPLIEPSDNGKTWNVDYWFNFENKNMRNILSRYKTYFSLLNKAGVFDKGSSDYEFLDGKENYTIFVPSEEALTNYQADTLSIDDLTEFIKYHFLRGELIFTDNKQPSGNYFTAGDSTLNLNIGPDIIEILDQTGNPYVLIPENSNTTNIMVSTGLQVTSVVHEIDSVLIH